MGDIIQMPKQLREKIAAGEVITGPDAVVKELIENSIDAGATEIRVYIERGGKRLIRVSDNGRGMDLDDLKLCAQRFTTSKMHSEEELASVSTLGFRGEALASITTVAELYIQSRCAGAAKAYAVEYDSSGLAVSISESSIPAGTSVEVRNLFGKFPVRLKFLKSDEAEFSKVRDIVVAYSLCCERIAFRLYKDGEEHFVSPASSWEGKLLSAFGRELAENVIPLNHSKGRISVSGFISKVGYSRKTRDYQLLYVNGRPVKSRQLLSAVENGYPGKLFLDRHPVAIVHLNLPPEMIDVNVHPSKQEIKFHAEGQVIDAITAAVSAALASSSSTISADAEAKLRAPAHSYEVDRGRQTVLDVDVATARHRSEIAVPASATAQPKSPKSEILGLEVIGQANRTYILCSDRTGLVLVDQHAAQERVFYERFTAQLRKGAVASNELLKPFILSVDGRLSKAITENLALLERYGVRVEQAGPAEFAVTALPAVFGKVGSPELVRDMAEEIAEAGTTGSEIDDALDHKVATRACRKAVKGGDILSIEEMKAVLYALAECDNPYTCPHGRPTLIRIGWGDLERKFKRTD